MKKFNVKFSREFEVDVEAETTEIAQALARNIIAQFPKGSCKLLSIIAEDYVEPAAAVKVALADQQADKIAQRNAGLAKNVRGLTSMDDLPNVTPAGQKAIRDQVDPPEGPRAA